MAGHLTQAVKEHPEVAFGSYPFFNSNPMGVKTVFTVESTNEREVERAVAKLVSLLPDVVAEEAEGGMLDDYIAADGPGQAGGTGISELY